MPSAPTVVVGASLAGLRAVEALRRLGDDGPVVVVGAEAHRPYDRPPLSKRALTDLDADLAGLTALPVPDDLGVEWCLGTPATGVDLARRRVRLAGGDDLAFDRLVLATGATPRRLPGVGERAGVHVLRTLDDAAALRAELARRPDVAVIGAGWIGLEVASSCRQIGLEVAVLEAAAAPLAALGPAMGARVAQRHRAAGTRLELGAAVERLEGDGRVDAVRLADGRVVAAGVVVVGIGVQPEVAWLAGSGVDLDDGVRCDSRLRVLAGGRPVPGVVACGDVARWDDAATGRPTRAEHWTSAVEQAEAAAASLVHGDGAAPFASVPYFWSDQLGTKLQMVGTAAPGDEVALVDEDPDGGRWVAAYGRGGRLVAALGAGRAARIMRLRAAIADGAPWPPA